VNGRSYCARVTVEPGASARAQGERESKRELVFFNAPNLHDDPEKEIEQIKEILPDLLKTSDLIQDMLRDTLEKT
jgi:hypothetical protein